jgi:hypothetical protein
MRHQLGKPRKNAENCAEKAQTATASQDRARFKRMEKAWENLANNQAWLEGGQEGPPPQRRE